MQPSSARSHADAVHPEDPYGTNAVRVWGEDRYETAVAISQAVWNTEDAAAVFLATGSNFPDALAGAASTLVAGPILLTLRDSLPQVTADRDRPAPALLHHRPRRPGRDQRRGHQPRPVADPGPVRAAPT